MPSAAIENIEVFYEISGHGPLIVLVSGLAGVASFWAPNIDELATAYTVLRFDQRGTGRSSRWEGDYSVELLAEDLVGLMNHLELKDAIILGHSTGGAIGQVVAAHHPHLVSRLILYASWATLCPQMRICMEVRQRLLRASGPEAYFQATPIFLYAPRYVCDSFDRIEAEREVALAASTTQTILDARIAAVIGFDGKPYLDRIRAPTLVLVAQDDILTPPVASHELAAGIKGAEMRTFEYGAHAISYCEPHIFNAAIMGFVARTASTVAANLLPKTERS